MMGFHILPGRPTVHSRVRIGTSLVRFKSDPLAAFSFRAHLHAALGTKKQQDARGSDLNRTRPKPYGRVSVSILLSIGPLIMYKWHSVDPQVTVTGFRHWISNFPFRRSSVQTGLLVSPTLLCFGSPAAGVPVAHIYVFNL